MDNTSFSLVSLNNQVFCKRLRGRSVILLSFNTIRCTYCNRIMLSDSPHLQTASFTHRLQGGRGYPGFSQPWRLLWEQSLAGNVFSPGHPQIKHIFQHEVWAGPPNPGIHNDFLTCALYWDIFWIISKRIAKQCIITEAATLSDASHVNGSWGMLSSILFILQMTPISVITEFNVFKWHRSMGCCCHANTNVRASLSLLMLQDIMVQSKMH